MEHNNQPPLDFPHFFQNLIRAMVSQAGPHQPPHNDIHPDPDMPPLEPIPRQNGQAQSPVIEDRDMTPVEHLEGAMGVSLDDNAQQEIVDREMTPAEPELDGRPPLEPITPMQSANVTKRAMSDTSSLPSLQSVSDSSVSSDSSSVRDTREVEMMDATQAVDDDGDSNWTDVSSASQQVPPLEPIVPPRGANRRVRVDEIQDEYDRPRSRQRTSGPAAANVEAPDGTEGQAPPPGPAHGQPGLFFIPIGTIVPLRPANSFDPGMGFAFTMTLNGVPVGGVPLGQTFVTGQPRQPQDAEPNVNANANVHADAEPHAPHPPINPFEFFTLLGHPNVDPAFLNFVGGIGMEQDQDDPERAKKLVDGLEEVPVGLVKRMERVGGAPGAHLDDSSSASAGGSDIPGCAICWDKLLPDDVDEAAAGEGQSTPSTDKKIVSLPCAHVFHAACLIPWFSRPRHTTCPTCRFNVDPDNLTYVRRPRRRPTPSPSPEVPPRPAGAADVEQPGPVPLTPAFVVPGADAPGTVPNPPAEPAIPPPAQPDPPADAQAQAGPQPNPRRAPHFFVQPIVTVDFNLEYGAPGEQPRAFNIRQGPQVAGQAGGAPFPFPFPFAQAPQAQAGDRPAQPPAYGSEPPPQSQAQSQPQQEQPQPQSQPQPQPQGPRGPPGAQDAEAWLQWMLNETFRGVPVPQPGPQAQSQQEGPQPAPQPQPQQEGPQPAPQPQPQPQGRPHIHGPQIFFGPPPGFDMGGFPPVDIPMSGPGPSQPREKKEWTAPPPPGPTLRQRVEQKEREAGLRCDDVSCGLGPTDEDPIPCVDVARLKQVHIRPVGSVPGGDRTQRVCAHKFHPACLVSAERVAGWGEMEDEEKEEKGLEEEVEVSCPVCRAVGVVSGEEWSEGVRALA
ncbi:hypothetical protein NEOLEDRAFT_1180055 [Neolentinus lepideus HHB14362 ss-1]|uniref:RING-type domain-containing protein n=1 Tax=Neolentinus lepideus HHB14362 ss-1 TaxID=1314782 RepID=A0A165R739_9AGAM|nr:hypothetical protein NEOLEDRAFT_1180055 [Neolentinus lepideus HHB14362 ss-1]